MVMTKGSPDMGGCNTPSAGGADIEPQEAAYDVPSAGGDAVPGGYPAPTPHAAAVAQDPFMAPVSDGVSTGGVSHAGFDAMEHGLGMPTSTPGEAAESAPAF